jgi:hypothetical protein
LGRGVSVGEDLIRNYKLKSVVSAFDKGVKGVYFYYTHDLFGQHIRLLLSSHLMTIEYRWKMLSGENKDGFLKALNESIDQFIPDTDVNEKRELDLLEYEEMARKMGLEW